MHNWQALAQSASTLVFVMGMKNLPDIARNLLDAGLDPRTPGGPDLPGHHAAPAQPGRHPAGAAPGPPVDARFTNPSVIVVGKVASLHGKLNWFEQKPLLGKSIVVTRAREQASGLARSLAGLGAEVIQCPTLKSAPCPTHGAGRGRGPAGGLRLADFHLGERGAPFLVRLDAAGKDSRALGTCKVAAIGPATADAPA